MPLILAAVLTLSLTARAAAFQDPVTGTPLASVPVESESHPFEHPPALHYRASLAVIDSTLWVFSVDIPRFDGPFAEVTWRSESGDAHRQQYRIDEEGRTVSWNVSFPERGSDYSGEREGNRLTVSGQIEGVAVDESFGLDDDAFFFNVALGMAAFVRRGDEQVDFWAFRPEDASVVHMDAKREGVDTLMIDGVEESAIRVRWAPKGWRGLFYSRRFWFRPSDGALLRTDEDEGRVTTLRRGE